MNALNKQVDQHIAVTAQHIAVSKQLRKEMLKTKPLYDVAKPEQQLAVRIRFAELIGKENGIKPIMTNRGDVGFDRKTKIGDAARKMLSYYFPAKVKTATPATPKVSKQVDEAEELLKQLYSLSKKVQTRFITLLEQDGVI
jgi:alkyl hydroperoxide reductase subunit AhpC